ncbi:MAG: S49 family peptidase [Burkholderiaceae bacterium]|nr:S49 family peptidase [Burkholderiaceae bacterium]
MEQSEQPGKDPDEQRSQGPGGVPLTATVPADIRGEPRLDSVREEGKSSEAAGWERQVLQDLVAAALDERRRARRWGIFFKAIGFSLVALFAAVWFGLWIPGGPGAERHTAVIDIAGVIEAEGETSADAINGALRAAFEDRRTAGIVLRINSPGGSPVQAGIIHDEIRRLRGKHPQTLVYAVVEEVCASGGYYVAVAADQILVDKASLVGSIGVLLDGFGFVDIMDRLGVERRLLIAGANKGFLDSFSPLVESHRAHAQSMLDEIHRQFIAVVKKGRGDRLKESPETFSGTIWTGARSVEIGLADGLGSVGSVARDLVKADDIVDFTPHRSLAERVAKRVGASAGESLSRGLRAATEALRIR